MRLFFRGFLCFEVFSLNLLAKNIVLFFVRNIISDWHENMSFKEQEEFLDNVLEKIDNLLGGMSSCKYTSLYTWTVIVLKSSHFPKSFYTFSMHCFFVLTFYYDLLNSLVVIKYLFDMQILVMVGNCSMEGKFDNFITTGITVKTIQNWLIPLTCLRNNFIDVNLSNLFHLFQVIWITNLKCICLF